MNNTFSITTLSILVVLFILPSICQAQKKAGSKPAKQIIGTWIVKEFGIEAQEEYKNDSQTKEYIAQNRENIEKTSKKMANKMSFTFIKGGSFIAKEFTEKLENRNGTWRIEQDTLHLNFEDERYQQGFDKLKFKFENDMLHLGMLVENGLIPNTRIVLVFKKGNVKDLVIKSFNNLEDPPVKPEMTTTLLEDFIIDAQEGDCGAITCLRVKRQNAVDWENFEATIEGFKYEKGYEYNLKVYVRITENPPTDDIITKIITYKLKEIVSKTKK